MATKTTESVIYREIELKVTGTVTVNKGDRNSWASDGDYYGEILVEDLEATHNGEVVELDEYETEAAKEALLASVEDCDG